MSEKLWHLKSCEVFQRLTPGELQFLENRSKARRYPRKSPIYLPADEADAVLLLATGRAKICHLTLDGKQSILALIEPGELFGELAVLESGQRDEYAETIEPSTVVMMPAAVVQQLMQDRPDLSLGITKLIGLRRRRIERRLKNLLFLPNRDRLVHLLLELAEQYGTSTPDGIALKIKLSHQELANVIGSTRETVTVVLGQLQSEGLIQVGRRRIVICQPQRLAGVVQSTPPTLPHPWPATSRE